MAKILPPSQRQQTLAKAKADLAEKSEAAFSDAKAEATLAKAHGQETLQDLGAASAHATDMVENAGRSMGSALKGSAYAAAGAVAKLGEEVGDLVGAAMQNIGRGLISAGNFFRRISGGPQVVVRTIEGKQDHARLSERLFSKAGKEFDQSAHHFSAALGDLISCGGDMKSASKELLHTAEHALKSARNLGEAAAIKAAEVAVAAAKATVDAVERGIDGAGSLMQETGQKVIAAGNALNTAKGTDTAVEPK